MWFSIKWTHSLGCVKRKKSDINVSKLIFKLVTSFLRMFLVGQRLNLDISLAQHLTLVLIPTRWQHHIMHFARQTKMGWINWCQTKIIATTQTIDLITHLPLDKMVAISQMTFSNEISWMKSLIFWFEFRWSLFLRVQLKISQRWFR